MNLSALEIDGFGVWSGLQVERFSDSLNVIHGPNEAGKTTLLHFIRSMLYGFSPARRRYLPPVHGGRPGGTLAIASPHGRFVVCRYDEPSNDGAAERFTLTAPDGTRQGEQYMKVLLAGVDEAVFNNVFAVGLREMQELSTLGDTEAAAMLYNLTAGLDRVSLVEVLGELRNSRNRLLDESGGPCRLLQLLAEREKIRSEIEELSTVNRRYGQIAAERDQLHEEVLRLEEESARIDHAARLVELALAVRERWNQRAALDRELSAIGPLKGLPEGALERLDAMNARLEKFGRRRARLAELQQSARREYAALSVGESLSRQAARIEALKDQEPWIVQLHDRIESLKAEIGRIEAESLAEGERLGLAAEWTARPLLSAKGVLPLRAPAKSLGWSRRLLAEAEQTAATAGAEAETLQARIESELKSRGESDLTAAMDRAGSAVAQLRRRMQLDDRADQLTRSRAELEERSRGLVERQMLPMRTLAGLGAMFVVGSVLLLSYFFIPATFVGVLGAVMAVLGVAGIVAAVGGKWMLDRSNLDKYDACRKQLDVIQSQMKQTEEDRQRLDAQLPRGGGSIQIRLQAAERELTALEELSPLEARCQTARQEAESARRRAEDAAKDFRTARRRWHETLSALGLPHNVLPKHIRRLARYGDRMAERRRLLERRREELGDRRREWESTADRIVHTAADAGVALQSAEPLEQLRQLSEAAARQEAAVARREVIRRESRRRRIALAKRDEAVERLKHLRRRLFIEAGAADERDFRRLAVESARADVLQRQRDAITRDIETTLASHCSEEAVRRQLDGEHPASLEARREELRPRAAAVQQQLRDALERRGRLAAQLDVLASNRNIAEKHLEMGVLDKRIEDAVHQWRTLAATCAILDAIRSAYERHRQPEALREASGYLERLTQGRYVRVWTPLGEQTLRVDDAEGHSLPVESLSRGTREQLFLGLRMALAASYARRGAALPLVLDDVLVNFDADRAKAAAVVLRDYAAAGHQLLVFTCHEHILNLFQAIEVPVGRLPNNAAPGRVVIAATHRAAPREVPREEPREETRAEPEPAPRPARRKAPARSKRRSAEPSPENEPQGPAGGVSEIERNAPPKRIIDAHGAFDADFFDPIEEPRGESGRRERNAASRREPRDSSDDDDDEGDPRWNDAAAA